MGDFAWGKESVMRYPLSRIPTLVGPLLLLALLSLSSCVTRLPRKRTVTLDSMLRDARAEGLDLKNPIAINDEMKRDVMEKVGMGAPPLERIERLMRYLTDQKQMGFHYSRARSLTAIEAFHAREGDCISYSNLYVGLARYLKLPVYFVDIDEAPHYYMEGKTLFRSSHIAVAYTEQYNTTKMNPFIAIVDFSQESSRWKLWLYQLIDDSHAMALFYNNIAVERMTSGDFDYAERLLTFLLKENPNVKEIYNNLAVVKMDLNKNNEALDILRAGIIRFPDYHPYYSNAVQAAHAAGKNALAEKYQKMGMRLASSDPFFLFNQGIKSYNMKDFAEAEKYFKAALKKNRSSPFLYAWLARVYLESGQEKKGIKAFRKVQELAPNHPMLKELRDRFPALKQVPLPVSPALVP